MKDRKCRDCLFYKDSDMPHMNSVYTGAHGICRYNVTMFVDGNKRHCDKFVPKGGKK